MSKKLIVPVLLIMMAASAAMAGEMEYTIYGVYHVSTDLQNNGDDSSLYVASNTTRVGIKGYMPTDVEWLTVIWQFENQADFNNDIGVNGWSSRNSFAGVKGEWGKLIWGRYDSPIKSVGRMVEFFPERIGDARNATAYFGKGWDNRYNRMFMYNTPKLGELFDIRVQVRPSNGTEKSAVISGAVFFEKDAFKVAAAYESKGKGMHHAVPDSAENSGGFRVSAKYGAERWGLGGLYQGLTNVNGVKDMSAMTWGVGGHFLATPMWDLKAQFYMFDPNTDMDNDASTMIAVGVDYVLTQKTRLYLVYGSVSNEDLASADPFRGGHGARNAVGTAGETPYGVSVGLYGKF